jgi:histidine phosphotransferase ChpT
LPVITESMTHLSPLALSQLLITRLCHDITGPIGAINNGMEVLAEDPSMKAQAMELIAGSAAQAGARIQFYRYLFGMLKGAGIVDMNDKKELIAAFYHGSRIEILWESCPDVMTQAECQIFCNMLLIAGSTLMRGGVVTVNMTADGEALKEMHLHAEGATIKLDEELRDGLLNADAHTPTTKSVQAYYTALLAAEQGGTIAMQADDTGCHIYFHANAQMSAHHG